MAAVNPEDPESRRRLRSLMGPGQADQSVRQAIQMCWMQLPEDRKTVDELERQIRRLVDRAFADLREDFEAFGLGE